MTLVLSRLTAGLFTALVSVALSPAACADEPADHWAFQPPRRSPSPAVHDPAWPKHPLDRFVQAHREQRQIPRPPAAKPWLALRRLSYAIRGLPPDPDEVAELLDGQQPDALERIVDRYFASPRHGERMAAHWLDLARYADTHGYHADTHRDMWRWRDWVIDAWNRDLPYHDFTVEQLAGDLLPHPTLDQQIATGFNRNHMVNFENGAIDEEYRLEYVADRTTTTATVWLGLTLQCARCHDHKHDPLRQREFYSFFAYFNNVDERGLDGQRGNAVPLLKAPTMLQQLRMAELDRAIPELERLITARLNADDPQQIEWEQQLVGSRELRTPLPQDATLQLTMEELQGNRLIDVQHPEWNARVNTEAELAPGTDGQALVLTGETGIQIDEFPAWRSLDPLTIVIRFFPTSLDDCQLLQRTDSQRNEQGIRLFLRDRQLGLRWVQDGNVVTAMEVTAEGALEANRWYSLVVTMDGSGTASGVSWYVNGERRTNEVRRADFVGPLVVKEPLWIGGAPERDGLRGLLDDVRIFGRQLSEEECELFTGRDPLRAILTTDRERRTEAQRRLVRRRYLEMSDAQFPRIDRAWRDAVRDRRQLEQEAPTTMVMRELGSPRETRVLLRGLFDQPGETVQLGLPEVLNRSGARPASRLELARWLGSADNPLAGRVMVNRLWQLHFGRGLVATPDDFGTRGAPPSNPDLLDWLASDLFDRSRASNGSLKRLQRQMLLSSTFLQASDFAPSFEHDPDNRWLSRGPRLRLAAEMIRDQALAASGLLVNTIGGPSVLPYQPPGLWEEVAYDTQNFTAQTYHQSHGADLARRSVYTFWKRSVPPVSLAIWDAPDREVCTLVRSPTDTPLQALALMNDPTYLEAARYLAETLLAQREPAASAGPPVIRSVRSTGPSRHRVALESDLAGRILAEAFLRILGRSPDKAELDVLIAAWQRHAGTFRDRPDAARTLLSVGEAPRWRNDRLEDTAALTAVVASILALDEAIHVD